MSDKCPKCGEERRFNYEGFFLFGCDTEVYRDGSGKVSQSAFCTLRQTVALKDKEIAELREGLRPFAERLEHFKEDWGDADTFEKITGKTETYVPLADLRRASALLKGEKEGEGALQK